MKKQFLIALLASAALIPAAQAADDYVGLNVGRVAHKGTITGTGSAKDNDVGYSLYFGHQINNTWGVELGYTDLGKFEVKGGGLTVGVAPLSLNAAITATWPVSPTIAIFGKAGFSRNRTELTAPGLRSFKENDTNSLLGFGATFALNKQVALTVQYEDFSKVINAQGANLKSNMLSAGVRYGF